MKNRHQLIQVLVTGLIVFLASCAAERGTSSSSCPGRSCQAFAESGKQVYRFSIRGSSGVLEHKAPNEQHWQSSEEKPVLDGFAVAGIFGMGKNILVAHCDESGNRQFLKFNSRSGSWSNGRFQTGGCRSR